MRILVQIGHPAHVHLFKNLISKLKKNNHQVYITVTDKEMTTLLLNELNINFTIIGKNQTGLINKAKDLINKEIILYKYIVKKNIDLLIGVASSPLSHVGKILNIPSFIMDDTEHSKLEISLYKDFATKIFTPSCFTVDFGSKHVRYPGYHELAYLHPKYYKPDPSIFDFLGIQKNEKYILMRFPSWNAAHDSGQSGLNLNMKRLSVKAFSKICKIFITSEDDLPPDLEKFRIKIPPSKIHDALYYSHLYFGDGGTMASEAAVLGVPAIFISSITTGYLIEAEEKYGLIQRYESSGLGPRKALLDGLALVNNKRLKSRWKKKKDIFLSEKVDVTSFMFESIVNHLKQKR